MSLKELTYEHHKKAETRQFVKIMFSGKINHDLYATYLYNLFPMYELLEVMAMTQGLLNDIPEIIRSKKIWEDFSELWGDRSEKPQTCAVVKKYLDHIMSIKDDPKKLMAHIYVRHMGDLSGGQMIAKRVPGSGNYYKFEADTEDLKNRVRAKLDDSLADEARICFDFSTELFEQMMDFVKWEEPESGTH